MSLRMATDSCCRMPFSVSFFCQNQMSEDVRSDMKLAIHPMGDLRPGRDLRARRCAKAGLLLSLGQSRRPIGVKFPG